ncbi:hypothetical protein CGC59_08990 [Capnocytophaga sputigena]|jgi:hypothetical protein|uniref:Uncharacterized protein n=1 Tax=Capnocytophaga sputigena TaxID=1019 RepID=A0A2A3N720_CAPSP|nr:hypothetical protein [Capnocytophaga sputigena]ATA79804.1 hypothetical protein CGC59_08990 [Capnocytophaga sputigena]PBN47523.1 hypothetical protein CDC50_02745 [Capnocytophaga sputigena]
MKKANLTKVQLLQNSLILILSSIATEEKSIREGSRKKVTKVLLEAREKLLKEILEAIEEEKRTKNNFWKIF